MFKRIFGGQEVRSDAQYMVPEIEDDQVAHQFTDVQILSGHHDNRNIVDSITKIDETRILTTGQDKKGIVWDCKTGEIICELIGHKQFISASLVIENYLDDDQQQFLNVVVTAASDESIKIWDISCGKCKQTITQHNSAVKCFAIINREVMNILSAGENICLWSHAFQLLSQLPRNSLDYINTMIMLKYDRIVAATDQPHLVVYEMKVKDNDERVEINEHKKLPPHRQSITTLVVISEASFASASIDGSIIVWTAHRFTAAQKYNTFESFVNLKDHTYPFHVHHLMVAEQRYLFAAIGSGFAVYDTAYNRCITQIKMAHHAQITSLLLLQNGNFLATSSMDGTIRLWASPVNFPDTPKVYCDSVSRLFRKNLKETKRLPLPLQLVGECSGHPNSIMSITECGDEGFVSCDNDGLIILWKDSGRVRLQEDQAIRIVVEKLGWMVTERI